MSVCVDLPTNPKSGQVSILSNLLGYDNIIPLMFLYVNDLNMDNFVTSKLFPSTSII